LPADTAGQSVRGATADRTPSAPLEGDRPGVPDPAVNGRTARKRQAIMEAATALFLRDGYRNTSMDQVASDAAVSKQTVYKQFADKEQLFRDIVLGVTGNSEAIVADMTSVLRHNDVTTPAQLRTALTELARNYLDGVLQPHVLALRRLIIAEAERFPDLASAYFEQAPARGIDIITDAIQRYNDRGLLTADDPRLAGAHFAYLALAIAQDRAYFYPHERPSRAERDRLAEEAARIFIAAYGPKQTA
jgi:TetR/AcrR family transcriptional regulator, mexJK operon transcriptional repressor